MDHGNITLRCVYIYWCTLCVYSVHLDLYIQSINVIQSWIYSLYYWSRMMNVKYTSVESPFYIPDEREILLVIQNWEKFHLNCKGWSKWRILVYCGDFSISYCNLNKYNILLCVSFWSSPPVMLNFCQAKISGSSFYCVVDYCNIQMAVLASCRYRLNTRIFRLSLLPPWLSLLSWMLFLVLVTVLLRDSLFLDKKWSRALVEVDIKLHQTSNFLINFKTLQK